MALNIPVNRSIKLNSRLLLARKVNGKRAATFKHYRSVSEEWSLPFWCMRSITKCLVLITPDRIFSVRFRGISGEFGPTMVRIFARWSRAEILKTRAIRPDILPKRTRKTQLSIYHIQVRPKVWLCQVSNLISQHSR